MGACIIRVRGKKLFGKALRYSVEKQAYLVEIRKTKSTQWVDQVYVETKTHRNGEVKK